MFMFMRTKTSDLSEFGTGHMLYFYFLRYLTLFFLVITVIQGIPSMLSFSRNGNFYTHGGLAKITLGNYGFLYQESWAAFPSKVGSSVMFCSK